LLRECLDAAGSTDTEVEVVMVATPQDADRLRFAGSPTFAVNGLDVFADPGDSIGVCCRMYPTRGGATAGLPDRDELVDRLRRATGKHRG
jgi:hypothetical protein